MRREDVHVMIWTRGVFLFCCSTPKVFFDFCIRNGLLVTTVQPSYTVTLAPYSMTYTHAYIHPCMHTYVHTDMQICIQNYVYNICMCVYIYKYTRSILARVSKCAQKHVICLKGAGVALETQLRGLNVACVEQAWAEN